MLVFACFRVSLKRSSVSQYLQFRGSRDLAKTRWAKWAQIDFGLLACRELSHYTPRSG